MTLDHDFVIVIDDHGRHGLAFSETDLADATRAKAVKDIAEGQYERVVAIIQFNPAEGWCHDITVDVLAEVEADARADDHEATEADYRHDMRAAS